MDWITSPEAWIALLTLTTLEIVLGIDNIIFIAILAERLPEEKRAKARRTGLSMAIGTRILLLTSIVWIDLILIVGGMFLLFKSTREIHHKLEGDDASRDPDAEPETFLSVIVQITLLDVVFSLDSVITAVGVADDLAVMIIAVLLAGGFMIAAASPVILL